MTDIMEAVKFMFTTMTGWIWMICILVFVICIFWFLIAIMKSSNEEDKYRQGGNVIIMDREDHDRRERELHEKWKKEQEEKERFKKEAEENARKKIEEENAKKKSEEGK